MSATHSAPSPASGRVLRRGRLASLDALRGCTVAAMLLVNDPGDWGHVYWPLEHAAWNGFTPTDLVFPLFLFVVGVSVALAIVPRLEEGAAPTRLIRSAGWRALRILGLGLAINLLAALLLPDRDMRIPGVLQRIAICYAAVAWLAIYTKSRMQWSVIALLLLGYAGLLWLGGSLAPWTNLVSRTDSAVFGRFVWAISASGRGHDPEGLLSTLPAIASCLLGLRAGCALRADKRKPLLLAGVLALVLGLLWSHWLPFNKNLWTSSYVLWTTGLATLILLGFRYLIDARGWPALGRRFGMNAIAAYAGSELMQIVLPGLGQESWYRAAFADWMTPRFGPYLPSLAFAIVFVAFWWVIVWAMDRRRIYLKL